MLLGGSRTCGYTRLSDCCEALRIERHSWKGHYEPQTLRSGELKVGKYLGSICWMGSLGKHLISLISAQQSS